MTSKIPKNDSKFDWNLEEIKTAYKDAAEYDQFMFGDFDYSDVWLNDENNDVA